MGLAVQELVGNIDVKTKSVHFYVQRNSTFDSPKSVILFEFAQINEGDAFNLTSGVFTAPVKGIYHFQFNAIKDKYAPWVGIDLRVNDGILCRTYVQYTSADQFSSASLSASLRLAVGDNVTLYNHFGSLYDNPSHLTHYSGWLLEEDLM